MPLSMAKPGSTVQITHMNTAPAAALARYMPLGLYQGAIVTIKNSVFNGPIILEIRGAQIALSHDLTQHIFVETLS